MNKANTPHTSLYVTLDTNIFVRYVTQGIPGCEQEYWDKLGQYVKDGKIILLLPEVVEIEFEKLARTIIDEIVAAAKMVGGHVDSLLTDKKLWNELTDAVHHLKSAHNEWRKSKLDEAAKRLEIVRAFFKLPRIVKLPFTQETMFKARRRRLAGLIPNLNKRADADCFIIESLLKHLDGKKSKSPQFLLCTENIADFGLVTENGKPLLHPLFRDEFPPSDVFVTLRALIEFIDSQKPIEAPTEAEIASALDKERTVFLDAHVFGSLFSREFTQYKALQDNMQRLIEPQIREWEAMRNYVDGLTRPQLEQFEALRRIVEEQSRPVRDLMEYYRRILPDTFNHPPAGEIPPGGLPRPTDEPPSPPKT